MNQNIIEEYKLRLANSVSNYVEIIKKEYDDCIPEERLRFLNSIKDFKNVVRFEETNTIALFVKNGEIYFPLSAFRILDNMKAQEGFGSNKDHKPYSDENIILNDNTFFDYIQYVFLAGLTPLDYYEEVVLHESLHLCGARGGTALEEGFTELKTRELAKKYKLKTSGCAYPKEVAIAYELQQIIGDELSDSIVFAINYKELLDFIKNCGGEKMLELYSTVFQIMEDEFSKYLSVDLSGDDAHIKRAKSYEKIDYSKAHEVINNYSKTKNIK